VLYHFAFKHTYGNAVWHQFTAIHIALGQGAEFGLAFDVGAENIASTQVNQVVFTDEVFALGAFASAWRSKKYNVQHSLSD
jgi:hypothetical protein